MGAMNYSTAETIASSPCPGPVDKQLLVSIAKILDEAKSSNATHVRKVKELSLLYNRCGGVNRFLAAFFRCITPVFLSHRRTASTERVVRFVSDFACSSSQSFLEEFLRFLLSGSVSNNKTTRFRACQIISEIIMRLPDDAEVSGELWDEVIESMKVRMADRIPLVRTFAVRALSRFINDAENSDVLELMLHLLSEEQNSEVRKTIVLALPPSNAALDCIIDCTLDVSVSVRKASYCVLASKYPLQSLSIKQRAIVLRRGLIDRSESVSHECLKLMRDEWLFRCCNDDPVQLLKYLDVETYESVGEILMSAILKDSGVKVRDIDSIRNHVLSTLNCKEGEPNLIDAESAFFWRTVCSHLQNEARLKGSDAAATSGTEAEVYAAEATARNDLLESILPSTTSDFIALVQNHIDAGQNYHFSSRQLLLLGSILDFSDITSQKAASTFVHYLILKPLDHEVDEKGNKVAIGDGINIGGDKKWAYAVSNLLRKIHASPGQFEEEVFKAIDELAKPCRERTADFMQWMHCLSLACLFMEHANTLHWNSGVPMSFTELLHSLLLPGVRHSHLDVQRVAVRCLGLYALKETMPSDVVVQQLKRSFVDGPPPIRVMACKALFDISMWHGMQNVDELLGKESEILDEPETGTVSDVNRHPKARLLDLFYEYLGRNDGAESFESSQCESVQSVIAEGFCKILLLSENYNGLSPSLHPLILSKLINLYFSGEATDLERMKQCVAVFLEHYPSVSANHKKWLSRAFIPTVNAMWPGISCKPGGSSVWVSTMRKRAVQASRFMLQMIQSPLYAEGAASPDFVEEELALRIAAEVAGCPTKKSSAERAYAIALCKILGSITVRTSHQSVVKLLRLLLPPVIDAVSSEKDVAKDLLHLADRLKSLDTNADEEINAAEAKDVLERMDISVNLDAIQSAAVPQTPRVARCTRAYRQRRQTRRQESQSSSDEEYSAVSVAAVAGGVTGPRSQRASKTAALSKMTSSRRVRIEESDREGVDASEDDEDSDAV